LSVQTSPDGWADNPRVLGLRRWRLFAVVRTTASWISDRIARSERRSEPGRAHPSRYHPAPQPESHRPATCRLPGRAPRPRELAI